MPDVDPRATASPAQPATDPSSARRIHLLLLVQGASFVVASMVHRGVLVRGYAHREAAIAEGVIGAVLLAGLAIAWAFPRRTRTAALGVQAFALLGTLVGAITIAIGVGPQTVPDVVYHLAILALLGFGLVRTARSPRAPGARAQRPPREARRAS